MLPISRFIAFGDFKPPGYIYTTVPSVFLFGLNEFSVRLPSILAGFFLTLMTYFLVYKLFKNHKLSLLGSFLLAISPWSIQMGRAAFEANLAALFNLLAVYFFIRSERKRWSILLSIVFFIFAFYTFNANRIISPLLILGLSLIYHRSIFKNIKFIILSVILAVILIWPSIPHLLDRESRVRFQEVSIFNDLSVVDLSNKRITLDNNAWWSKIIHNRRIEYTRDFLKHYFDNFSLRFLFTHGDQNPRLAVQNMGQLYFWELPFLIFGILALILKKEKALLPLLIWMFVSIIPAATAKETPHALRIISILPTYQIIIAYGVYNFILLLNNKYKTIPRFSLPQFFILSATTLLLVFNVYYYMHNYYIHYSAKWSDQWQYGYKEMVQFVLANEKKYDYIYVTHALGRPYIFFAFYGKYHQDLFLKERVATRDWFGFWTVERLGKISFDLPPELPKKGRILLVTQEKNYTGLNFLTIVKDISGNDVFYIFQRS